MDQAGLPQLIGLVAADAVIVLVASRVAGVSADLGFASLVAAVTSLVALAAAVLIGGPDRPPEASR